MSEKFEHKKLNEQRSVGDYCEFMLLENNEFTNIFSVCKMPRFAPFLGQIAGPDQSCFSFIPQTNKKTCL